MFTIDEIQNNIAPFATLMGRVNGYDSLQLDNWQGDLALELLSDGETAVVYCRNRGEIKRFKREMGFAGGHWSDVDIDNAIHD